MLRISVNLNYISSRTLVMAIFLKLLSEDNIDDLIWNMDKWTTAWWSDRTTRAKLFWRKTCESHSFTDVMACENIRI